MALAVVSLTQTLEQLLQFPHPTDLDICELAKTFHKEVRVVRDFLQNSCTDGRRVKGLEAKIINFALKADRIIRSNLLHIRNEGNKKGWRRSLNNLTAEIHSIVKEVMVFEKKGKRVEKSSSLPQFSLYRGSYPTAVVGLDDDFKKIKDRLRSPRDLQVVSVVGMGGIGKTTLVKSVYSDPAVAEHYDRCAWVTVSQDFQEREVYLDILRCFGFQRNEIDKKSNDQLAEQVRKSLKGRRYLIVLDDVWNTTTWDHLRRSFPNNHNGSRILLTTRLVDVAIYASSGKSPHHMRFLSEDEGWELLSGKVFGKQWWHPKLKNIGKQIVSKCRGLPLAILVVAGLLSKVDNTTVDWENVLENLNALVSSSAEDCFGILGLSYHQLPIQLKNCFVYTTLFPEDTEIPVSKLLKLWIAEGFLEDVQGTKSFEEVADACLEELIDRSLVLISKRGLDGKVKTCMVHDLLRELCLREANTEKFLLAIDNRSCVIPKDMKLYSRFGLQSMKWEDIEKILEVGMPRMTRSLLLSLGMSQKLFLGFGKEVSFSRFNLLRVLDASSVDITRGGYLMKNLSDLIYLRYLAISFNHYVFHYCDKLPCLQTFIVHYNYLEPLSIIASHCQMAQLRHLELGLGIFHWLDDDDRDLFPNLQTLSGLCPSSCRLNLFQNTPNLKMLGITSRYSRESRGDYNCLESVNLLHNLVKLKFQYEGNIPYGIVAQKLHLPQAFPINLKKLTLLKSCLPWKDMSVLVAKLPNLEVLKLKMHAFRGSDWETMDEGFLRLKVLVLELLDLVCWKASSDHFPRLQHLTVRQCYHLEGIPREIGDIYTLQEIELDGITRPVMDSAEEILKEQRNWGNDDFRVQFSSSRGIANVLKKR